MRTYKTLLLEHPIGEGQDDIVQIILSQGLVEKNTNGSYGYTALTWAVEDGQDNIVRMLEAADWTMDEDF
jgi:ankyrin repeat protein